MRLIYHTAGIVVESGIIYLLAQLVLVVLFSMENPAYKVVGYPIIQIYGIAPTLIFCRVGMGISSERNFDTTGASVPSFRQDSRYQRRQISTPGNQTFTTGTFAFEDDGLSGAASTIPGEPKLDSTTFLPGTEHPEGIELALHARHSGSSYA